MPNARQTISSRIPFTSAAVWAVQEGLTNGTSANTFTPGRDCSRGEILTFLYRQFG